MADTIIISCPECGKQLKVSGDAIGKKVRCKGCQKVIPVTDPAEAEAITSKKKAPAGKPAAKKPEKPVDAPAPTNRPAASLGLEGEDDDGKAYIMADMDLAPRCPQCAAPLDPPDSVICMQCGFNTKMRHQVRTRKVKEVTGQDKFMWMLPGILGIVGIVAMITYWCIHHFVLPDEIYPGFNAGADAIGRSDIVRAIADPESYLKSRGIETGGMKFPDGDAAVYLFHPGIELWILIVFCFISFYLGRLAVRRLILNREPPEVEIHK